jgi:thiamine-phosphate pyrophosphorylase
MLLIVLTPDKTLNNEPDIVNDLFRSGLQKLHLRKPLFSVPDYSAYLRRIDRRYHGRVVVHGAYGLLPVFGLGGIHLSSHARGSEALMQSIRHVPPAIISASFHSWQEVGQNDLAYKYVFISPVSDSISKAGYKAAIDLNGAMETKQRLAQGGRYCPAIIGLGGVGAGQIKLLDRHGFDGGAVLGAIWGAEDPVGEFLKINKEVILAERR